MSFMLCPSSPTYHTSVEQKLLSRDAARHHKFGSPKLQDLFRRKCRVRVRQSWFHFVRNTEKVRENTAVGKIRRRKQDEEEQYLIEADDTVVVVCPVCENAALKQSIDQQFFCECKVCFNFSGTLEGLHESIQTAIGKHELQCDQFLSFFVEQNSNGKQKNLNAMCENCDYFFSLKNTSVEQKLISPADVIHQEICSLILLYLPKKCRVQVQEDYHPYFYIARENKPDGKNLRQESADLESDLNLQEVIYKELIGETNIWYSNQLEEEEQYLIEVGDTDVVFCPVCENAALEQSIDQQMICQCGVCFNFSGTLDGLHEAIQTAIGKHELQCNQLLNFFVEQNSDGKQKNLNAMCENCDYFFSLKNTSVEQKLISRAAARHHKFGSLELRPLLPRKCRVLVRKARHPYFDVARYRVKVGENKPDGKNLRQGLADLESDLNLQEVIYKELIGEMNIWYSNQLEEEEQYLIEVGDTDVVFCPVCENAALEQSIDQQMICQCGVCFNFSGTLDGLHEAIQTAIGKHELQCNQLLNFFVEQNSDGKQKNLNVMCENCDYFISLTSGFS